MMRDFLSRLIKNNYNLYNFYHFIRPSIRRREELIITVMGGAKPRIIRKVVGKNNYMKIGEGTVFNKSIIHIRGHNNKILFGSNCHVGPNCSFWMEGNNIEIVIGDNTTFTHSVHFCAQEDNLKIIIGEDCMFSNNIVLRTSDSHIIKDKISGKRINPGGNIELGNHVWIAPKTTISKNVKVGSGSIIGSNTLVTKDIPSFCLAVGIPARVIKESIEWERDATFETSPKF